MTSFKYVALVDCNSFFCSCEKLFRPKIQQLPVGVVSGKDGCFVSCCYELRKLGVKVGTPYFKVKSLCRQHNVQVFHSDFALYRNLSDRVMSVLSNFSHRMEIYSVDEAFLDLSHIEEQDLLSYGLMIKEEVEKQVGIPVGIGIGRTKTLAKGANFLAKNNALSTLRALCGGVVVLNKGNEDQYLRQIPIGDVWGIGKASENKMRQMGIHFAYDLKNYKSDHLIKKTFSKLGLQKKEELWGYSCLELEENRAKKQQMMHSRSFTMPLYTYQEIEKVMIEYCGLLAVKMRRQKSLVGRVSVFMRSSYFRSETFVSRHSERIVYSPSHNTSVLLPLVLECLQQAFIPGPAYKKMGIIFSDFTDEGEGQQDLFTQRESAKSERLMQALDQINNTQGKNTICLGTVPRKKEKRRVANTFVSGWDSLAVCY